MASNSIQVKTNGYGQNYGYTFTITANLTGNTQGNQREVTISFDAEAYGSGGYTKFNNPMAYIYVNGEQKTSTQVYSIYYTANMGTWTGYVDAGQTIVVKGSYTYDHSTDYMPKTGTHEVTVNLEVSAISGTVIKINQDGTWKNGLVWAKKDGVWHQGLIYINQDGVWK